MSYDEFCDSPPAPEEVQEEWIPTGLYRLAVEVFEDKYPTSNDYLEPTACPSHIRYLQPLASAPTCNFRNDKMMPGFCQGVDFEVGCYRIGRVQMKHRIEDWIDVALIVNDGDADANTGHWGGAFLIGEDSKLTPAAWIRSVGDSVTYVEQAKQLSDDFLQGFCLVNAEMDPSMFKAVYHAEKEEMEDFELFGEKLVPGLCKTPLEKLVGLAYGQLLEHDWKVSEEIPPS